MADTFELVALALPGDTTPESLPAIVRQFIAECWPGMSRGQLMARAALRAAAFVARVRCERAGRDWPVCIRAQRRRAGGVADCPSASRRHAPRVGAHPQGGRGGVATARTRSAPDVAVLAACRT